MVPLMTMGIAVLLIAFLVSLLVVGFLATNRKFFFVPDVPNERSLHTRVVSRTGGIGIFAAIIVALTGAHVTDGIDSSVIGIACTVVPVLLVSFFDDKWDMPVQGRIVVHFIAAITLVYLVELDSLTVLPGINVNAAWAAASIAVLAVVWYTNLFNFMDGMDGLAGGMGVFGFGTLSALGFIHGDVAFGFFFAIAAAATSGFLVWNFPPARIFMGDVGSSGLGFFAGLGAIWGDSAGVVPFWQTALIFSPFVIDATVTLARRAIAGERIWVAHKTHFYQKAVQTGLSHRQVAFAEYLVMTMLVITTLFLQIFPSIVVGWVSWLAWALVYVAVGLKINRMFRT